MPSQATNLASTFFPVLLGALVAAAGCASPAPPAPPAPSLLVVAPSVASAPDSDANDPRVQVEKLADPAARDLAVHRLAQFFEDAMTKDGKDRNGPNVKPLLDLIASPMSRICVNGDLDEKMRSKVVRLLAEVRDPRGAPCLVEVLKDYEPDTSEEDVRVAARAVAEMKVQGAAGPLFEAFTKLRHSKPRASLITRDVHDALLGFSHPSWESPCISMIGRPIADRRDITVLKDELYWQITCAEILGRLGSVNAIEPLIKIVLSPVKADVQVTAIYALIKIGKPAIEPTVKVLRSENAGLVEYAKVELLKANTGEDGVVSSVVKKEANTAHVAPVALILGSIGREEAIQPMIETIAKADDVAKVVIARELLKLPISNASREAVQRVFEKTPITMTIPPGVGARDELLATMEYLFDAELVPWMVKTALAARGDEADLESVRAATLVTVMKLMKASQIPEVDKLYNLRVRGLDGKPARFGAAYEREYTMTKDLLKECGDALDCYFGKLRDPGSHTGDRQMIGMKSAYMVGVLGGPEVRAKLVELLPLIKNAAASFIAGQVIDRHSPKGDLAIAAELQRRIDEAAATKDPNQIAKMNPFRLIVHRLRTRTQ
ncbi:HEAT repeat domain-containing protein [Polyangium sp. 15x6]|uniref:HEAT repeat domain-containing protein n=1 Tax=Polyangium sp. 15x6 TaxID=3042687 RepID=UPI00249AEE91|nr:HEAT repeat domain-containing protein [Polyangium sp. 15x6]MDI3282154.1 HEAT repeat domain-containing protein [Polyangium sp. 15x6]